MPKIPLMQRAAPRHGGVPIPGMPSVVQIPTVRASAASFDKGSRAFAQAGQALGQVADTVQQWRQTRIQADLGKHKAEALQRLADYEFNDQANPDFENSDQRFVDHINGLQEEYGERIDDNGAAGEFSTFLATQGIAARRRIRDVSFKKAGEYGRGRLVETENLLGDMIPTQPPQMLIEEWKTSLERGVALGYITAEQGAKRFQGFKDRILKDKGKAQYARAMQDLRDNPAGFDASRYKLVDEKSQIRLQDQAQRRVEAAERQATREAEKRERQAERWQKETRRNNELGILQKFYAAQKTGDQAKITAIDAELETLASRRAITPSAYKAIKRAQSEPEKEENAFVKGELWEDISLGRDVRADVLKAAKRNDIDGNTLPQMLKAIGTREYKQAASTVTQALKPSPADKYAPDKHLRFSEAMSRFRDLAEEMEPDEAAREVIESYTADTRRTIRGLARPRYLDGARSELTAPGSQAVAGSRIEKARAETVQALMKGKITQSTYKAEMKLLNQHSDLIRSRNNIPSIDEDLSDRIKKNRKAVRAK